MKYRTIVADPPWPYGDTRYGFKGNGRAIDGDTAGKTFLPYGEMSLQAICTLPVRDMAERDAHLYLWTPNRYLSNSYEVAQGWGFAVSKALVWCKPPHARPLGGTFGSATEFVLFCRRGTLASSARTPQDWFQWPRGKHSQKPEAFIDLVEQVSPGPYLEMFARRARFGWDYWGDQSLGTAELPKVVNE